MTNFARKQRIVKINAVKAEIRTAGPIHRKDLKRQLRNLERDLREYDRLTKGA